MQAPPLLPEHPPPPGHQRLAPASMNLSLASADFVTDTEAARLRHLGGQAWSTCTHTSPLSIASEVEQCQIPSATFACTTSTFQLGTTGNQAVSP